MSFLEMLDVVNEGLIAKGEDPIAFDSDCREGICGTCGFLVDGVAARPGPGHDRLPAAHAALQGRRHDHARAVARAGLPRDQGPRRRSQRLRPHHPGRRLHVDQRRRRPGRQRHPDPEGHRRAGDGLGACIGCGACVAACKNASAALFTSAKVSAPGAAAAGPGRSATRASSRWSSGMDAEGLRQLLERRRVRSGVPEGDLRSPTSRG